MLGGCVPVAEPGRGWAQEARRGAWGRRPGAQTGLPPPHLVLRLLPSSAHPRAEAATAFFSFSSSGELWALEVGSGPLWRGSAGG